MWKISWLLLLMLFIYNFPRDKFVRADRFGPRTIDRKRETRGRTETGEENSAEIVGKWQNNGEAFEPKWRDGDSVPLFPFSEFSRYNGEERVAKVEEEEERKERDFKGRQSNKQGFDVSRFPSDDYQDYDLTENGNRRQGNHEENLSGKRNRLWHNRNVPIIERSSDKNDGTRNIDSRDNREATRYRETLQTRPNEYEQELNDEEYLKPRPRKRRPPQNYEFILAENEASLNRDKKLNDSWSKTTEKPTVSTTKSVNLLQNAGELKSLLKMQQEEGLSLSEILQRRNLTLNDLLKGNPGVIDALKTKNDDYIEETTKTSFNSFAKLSAMKSPRWVASTEATRGKNPHKDEVITIFVDSVGSNSRNDHAEGSFLESEDDTTTGKMIPRTTDETLVKTVITTSIPVAADSVELLQADQAAAKSRDSGEINAESFDEDEIMEFSDFTDYKKGRNGVSPVWLTVNDESSAKRSDASSEDKGSTLSIEKILGPTERSESSNNVSITLDPGKLDKNQIKELLDEDGRSMKAMQYSGESYASSSEKEYQNDAPNVNYYLEEDPQENNSPDESTNKSLVSEKESKLTFTDHSKRNDPQWHPIKSDMEMIKEYTLKDHQNTSAADEGNYDNVISEIEPEARAEIIELFASGSAGKRLERLLKSRNMSLEELISLRQRGSSKVHLAEVSRIRAEKIKHVNNEKTSTTLAPTKEIIDFEQRSNDHPSETVQTDDISQEYRFDSPTEMKNKQPSSYRPEETNDNRHSVEIVDLLTTFDSLPFAKEIQRSFAGEYINEKQEKLPTSEKNLDVIFIKDKEQPIDKDTSNLVQTGVIKEIVDRGASMIDVETNYKERNVLEDEMNRSEKGRTLSKIKPSIIASGAILGVTLVVFLAILIICRIQQKQRYKYRSTFSRAVFQNPALPARKLSNSSSLSTVMVNVVATSTAKRPEKNRVEQSAEETDSRSDIDNDSLDANDSWQTIPDYMK